MAETPMSSVITKPWLYIQVFLNPQSARDEGADTYHWVYLLDKSSQPTRPPMLYEACWMIDEETKARLGCPWKESFEKLDAAERPLVWRYRAKAIDMKGSRNARGRVRLCQVSNVARFDALVEDIYVDSYWSDMDGFSCRAWMEDVWKHLVSEEGLFEPEMTLSWHNVMRMMRQYAGKKEEEKRFDEQDDFETVPTWDLIKEEEIVS